MVKPLRVRGVTGGLVIAGAATGGGAAGARAPPDRRRHAAVVGGEATEPRHYPLGATLAAGAGRALRRPADGTKQLESLITIAANVLVNRHLTSPPSV